MRSWRSGAVELMAICALFVSSWLCRHELSWVDPARAGALLALSYGLVRLAVDCEGARHLLPTVAVAAGVLAGGGELLSLGFCWLPVACGLSILGSPRAAGRLTCMALGPAVLAVAWRL